jgi:hypothetical protein
MSTAGLVGAPEIEAWAKALIRERSLVDSTVDDLNDLWDDIQLALDHLASCPPMTEYTHFMLRQLETSERVALWALAA